MAAERRRSGEREREREREKQSRMNPLATPQCVVDVFTRRSDRHAPWISRERNLRSKIR